MLPLEIVLKDVFGVNAAENMFHFIFLLQTQEHSQYFYGVYSSMI